MADPAERSLIPLDQPKGAREQIIEERQQAGLSLGVPRPTVPPDMLLAAQPRRTPRVSEILAPPAPDPKQSAAPACQKSA